MSTTQDIIDTLLKHGWRWEQLDGDLPVLTNAPPGKVLCVSCGKWYVTSGSIRKCNHGKTRTDHQRKVAKAWYKKNRPRLLAYQKKWAANNREKRRQYARDWYRRNKLAQSETKT